ncbi:aldose epimerase family protein [Sphingomonas morindae]|uniref:Aldose 1-epimerase n=1 Tax=Sphingomonas morindae TaxID=1541170 RepID=A0ABY4XDQ1_9SPHN|nr:aldose epimerase family protein [Sphingomonas morindae]USI74974.1 galactose mutarotase [Sphingomonas morindae]
MIWKLATGAVAAAALAASASAGTVRRAPFGQLPDGRAVEAITLSDGAGRSATILTLGASVQALSVPDRAGHSADIVLGYDDLAGYLAKPNFFGATVGRVANRIAKGRFTLDGKSYQTPVNDGPNALHGGTKGFDKVLWTVIATSGGAQPSVTLRYVSPDGDQGYPGTLTATATYSLGADGTFDIVYRATTDRPTLVNLSNHTYWNLAGEGDPAGAMGLRMMIPATRFTPTDATAIPTGQLQPVAGTPFDFRTPTVIGLRVRDGRDTQLRYGRGYDHNWVVSATKPGAMQLMARVEDPASGRVMELSSDQPGLQFYSGNFLDGTITGKRGHIYREGDAIVLEPQMFPDTPNQPAFGSVRLDPGQTYENHIRYRFSAR